MALSFLAAVNETFSLLATQPNMVWHARLTTPALATLRMFRVAGFERMLILYPPLEDGVDILRLVHGSASRERCVQAKSRIMSRGSQGSRLDQDPGRRGLAPHPDIRRPPRV